MHPLRLPLAAGSGLFVTLAVFSLLWGFVDAPIEVGDFVAPQRIEFTRQIVETPLETKRVEKIARDAPPVVPVGPRIGGGDIGADPVRYQPPRVDVEVRRHEWLPTGQDRDVVPVVRVPPEYPAREAARGTEGWVKVQFSITAIGTVRDAVVIDASPKGAFDEAALEAIARWRYNPKVEGGVPVERIGVQTRIRFELDR
jgi:protein TonB